MENTHKTCSKCKQSLKLDNFTKDKARQDGFKIICISCSKIAKKEWCLSEIGTLKNMYNNQKRNSKRRGHNPPSYTFKEFEEWAYNNNYKFIYLKYKESGFKKNLLPSADRLNDYIGYSLDNIRMVTYKENMDKKALDAVLNRSTTGDAKCKRVKQYDLNGNFIQEFNTVEEAQRTLKINHISCVCLGKRKTSGGYIWKY